MKKLLILAGCFPLIMACNSNTSIGTNTAADSLSAAVAAKDSVLDKNKATALASVKAFGKGKLEEAFKDVSPDAVDYGDGTMKPVKGLDSMKVMFNQFLDAFPDYKGENFLVIGEGDHVVVFGDWSGTFKKPFMGMKPTGKSFKVKDADLFTFNDAGKITEHRSVQSGHAIFDMVGAKMK